MKDGMRSAVTSMPLSRPISAPQPIPVATPSNGEPVGLITLAARQADSATLAPTERSSPAVRITSVRPEAMKNSSARLPQHVEDVVRGQERVAEHASATQISATASRR